MAHITHMMMMVMIEAVWMMCLNEAGVCVDESVCMICDVVCVFSAPQDLAAPDDFTG